MCSLFTILYVGKIVYNNQVKQWGKMQYKKGDQAVNYLEWGKF